MRYIKLKKFLYLSITKINKEKLKTTLLAMANEKNELSRMTDQDIKVLHRLLQLRLVDPLSGKNAGEWKSSIVELSKLLNVN